MNSFIGWIGGKKLLRTEILKRFPKSFGRYIEVCGGAGWMLFAKDRHAKMEIYNDVNGDLVNLFRCIKYHCLELHRELAFMLNSRELFDDFNTQYKTRGLTDIQRAARFFLVIKLSYGSNTKSYGCIMKNMSVMIDYLYKIQERLAKVIIENKDFEGLIKVYDKSDALIYLDPPYYGTEKYYSVGFPLDDHIRLSNVLKKIKGKFILSYNDCAYIRELYKDYIIEEIVRNNNLLGRYEDKENIYRELLIRNY